MRDSDYPSSQQWNPARIHALAIYCSDGRWGDAFDEFCQHGLGLPRYDRFAVPGGPAWLTLRDALLIRAYDTTREHLTLLVNVHGLERIVLITHYGCAFYQRMLDRDADGCLPAQQEDVRWAASTLRAWFPDLLVEGYAALREGNKLSFRRIEEA